MPLLGYFPEELAVLVGLAMQIPLVAGVWYEGGLDLPNDLRVREYERTARDSVVSGAAERMPVHHPHKKGLMLAGRHPAGFAEIGLPGYLRPAFRRAAWRHRRVEKLEMFRGELSR